MVQTKRQNKTLALSLYSSPRSLSLQILKKTTICRSLAGHSGLKNKTYGSNLHPKAKQDTTKTTNCRSLAGHSGVVISGDWLVGGQQVIS